MGFRALGVAHRSNTRLKSECGLNFMSNRDRVKAEPLLLQFESLERQTFKQNLVLKCLSDTALVINTCAGRGESKTQQRKRSVDSKGSSGVGRIPESIFCLVVTVLLCSVTGCGQLQKCV